MKRLLWLIVLVGIFSASLAGAKYWAGTRIEREYRSALSALPESAAFRVKSESYGRGAFSSEARSEVEFLTLPGGPVAFSLVHHISHGPLSFPGGFTPFLAVVETRLEPSDGSSEVVQRFFQDFAELAAVRDRTVVGFDGRARSHFEIPPFRRTFGEKQVLVDWKGLTADSTLEKDWAGWKGTARLPGLEVSDREAVLKAADLGSALDVKKGALGLYLGSSEMTIGALSFQSLKGEKSDPVSLTGARMSNTLDEADGLLSGQYAFGIDTLQVATLALEGISVELLTRNVEAAFLVRLRKEFETLRGAGEKASGEQFAARVGDLARESLPSFVAKNPALEISRFEVSSQAGKFSAKAQLAVDGTGPPVRDFAALPPLLTVDANIAVDEGFLRQLVLQSLVTKLGSTQQGGDAAQLEAAADALLAMQLQPLVGQGYLVKENATYTAAVRYRRGAFTVNGKPISVPGRR